MGQSNCCIRVPLACIIDYKGFRGFVKTQYNDYNSSKCQIERVPSELQVDLDNLAKCLNLKKFDTEINIIKYSAQCGSIDEQDSCMQNIYYLSNFSSLFPFNPETNNKFRPEFIYRYNEPLHYLCQESLLDATKFLRTDKINQLIYQLEQLEILPIDSFTFKQILHLNGINIQYIGLIAHETAYPHIQELCQIEMIARSAKKLLNSFISEYQLQTPFQNDNAQITNITTDFLALVLGQTSQQDTEIFYTQILRPQILHDFQYTIPYPHNVPPGGLYHALLWHCHLNQGNPTPTFSTNIKLFSQRMLQILLPNYQQQSIQGKNMQLQLNNQSEQIPRLLTELSSLYFESEDYQNSQLKAKEAFEMLPQTCPFSLKPLIILLKISLKSESRFDASLQLFHTYLQTLDYTLGPFHPLHAFIYSTFSDYYMQNNQFSDALILKKSQVICCLRVLGNTHKITTEAFLSLADCLFKIGQQDKACAFLEKAFSNLINQQEIENQQQQKIQIATIANKIAISLYNQGKIEESINYSLKEVELLTQFAEIDNIAINILEAELNIAFASSLINHYDQCFEHIEKCWLIYDQFKIEDTSYFIKILKVVLLAIFYKLNPSKKECISMFVQLLQEAQQQKYYLIESFKIETIPYLITFCQKMQSVITFISNLLYELIKKNTDNMQININIPNYNRIFWGKYLKIIEEADPLKVKEILLLLFALMETVGIDFFKENLQTQ